MKKKLYRYGIDVIGNSIFLLKNNKRSIRYVLNMNNDSCKFVYNTKTGKLTVLRKNNEDDLYVYIDATLQEERQAKLERILRNENR